VESHGDGQAAQELCDTKAVFWSPGNTWQWASTSASNVAGWLVQAVLTREEKGAVYVHTWSLHQEEQHLWGEIRMTSVRGSVSIRSIDIQHADRTGLMISLSAAELGDLEAGGYKQYAALTQYLASTAAVILPRHLLMHIRQLFDDNDNCHTCFVKLVSYGI